MNGQLPSVSHMPFEHPASGQAAPGTIPDGYAGHESDATAEDYAREIGKYIAKKKERAVEVLYEFEITGLRPQETKWLGPLILVKPTEDGKMAITYTIKSAHSPGIVDGRLMAE